MSATETTSLVAPDIVCNGCANSIKNVLGRVPGVQQVDVDVSSKAVTVKHEPTVARETLSAALAKAGYPTQGS